MSPDHVQGIHKLYGDATLCYSIKPYKCLACSVIAAKHLMLIHLYLKSLGANLDSKRHDLFHIYMTNDSATGV